MSRRDQTSAGVASFQDWATGRKGGWIQTFTGRQFWPLDPRPEDVFIEDIAHALALKCRYGGHCRMLYSVAEHSVLVSRHVAPEHALAALLHDAAEAYLADIPRPVKKHIPGWEMIETAVEVAIAERFGVRYPWPDEVKVVDTRILEDERRVLMTPCAAEWQSFGEPLGIQITLWPGWYAEKQFLARFEELRG